MGVDAGTHGGATLGQRLQVWQGRFDVSLGAIDLRRPAIQHLAHAHWHGIHQVGAAGLHVLMHLRRLGLNHLHQVRQGWQ